MSLPGWAQPHRKGPQASSNRQIIRDLVFVEGSGWRGRGRGSCCLLCACHACLCASTGRRRCHLREHNILAPNKAEAPARPTGYFRGAPGARGGGCGARGASRPLGRAGQGWGSGAASQRRGKPVAQEVVLIIAPRAVQDNICIHSIRYIYML